MFIYSTLVFKRIVGYNPINLPFDVKVLLTLLNYGQIANSSILFLPLIQEILSKILSKNELMILNSTQNNYLNSEKINFAPIQIQINYKFAPIVSEYWPKILETWRSGIVFVHAN